MGKEKQRVSAGLRRDTGCVHSKIIFSSSEKGFHPPQKNNLLGRNVKSEQVVKKGN